MGRDEETNTKKEETKPTNKQTHKKPPGSGTIEFQSW
jgi:hypothetical protein